MATMQYSVKGAGLYIVEKQTAYNNHLANRCVVISVPGLVLELEPTQTNVEILYCHVMKPI
ncbi:hypothetical protein [Metabacillus rhizosphaerae]|uniref:hypothetical protein n=1 Tax=Metabacillus rhizosphaerae TaxID=3117747 RepID=UPI0039B72560